jgi:hypothetical protein
METRIYKISSVLGDKIYIGSTTKQLDQRLTSHKYNYNAWKSGTFKGCITSFGIFDDTTKLPLLTIDTYDITQRGTINISANTDMRNKFSWYPFIDGYAKTDANFSTLSKAFVGTKYNSYYITDQAPQVINVGYADPGAIIFRSISLNTTNINAPITDKVIFVDGIAPTYISDFRLLEPITSSGTAYSSFPTVAQLSSREYIVAYTMDKTPRTINFKIISNYRALSKNTLLDLDALTGNTLSDRYNIYGLSSDYDEKLRLFRSVF